MIFFGAQLFGLAAFIEILLRYLSYLKSQGVLENQKERLLENLEEVTKSMVDLIQRSSKEVVTNTQSNYGV